MKTWDAKIEVGDERIPADPSRYDTLKETARSAEAEAVEYIRTGMATEARVFMFKATKARGREEDRQASYLWLDDGKVFVDRDRSC